METPSLPKSWQEGNCHCGAIRFRALLPPLTTADATAAVSTTPEVDAEADNRHTIISCNCSICTRNGLLNVYSTREEVRVRLGDSTTETVPGSAELREKEAGLGYYMFGKKDVEHVFCLTCGSSVWVAMVKEGVDAMAVNVSVVSSLSALFRKEGG